MEFADHLAREFALENLLFWNDVRNFEAAYDSYSDEDVTRLSLAMYYRYIDDDAVCQVRRMGNLSV